MYQTPIPVCLPASNNGFCGILLIKNVFNPRCLLPSANHPRTTSLSSSSSSTSFSPSSPGGSSFPSRCVFTYHMVCTSASFTVPSWYRPIGEIAPGCLLSAAALPGKVCSLTQFTIAPIGEMAPGVPCKALIKSFNCIVAPVCVRWHPSVRWHRGAQTNTRNI